MAQHGGATTADSSSRKKANVDPERPPPLRQPFLGRETSRLDEAASLRHPLLDADAAARRQPWWASHKVRTSIMVNLAGIMERSDEQILPSLYSRVGAAFDATPSQLGWITLARAVVQAVASPIGGIAGFKLNRVWVISFGCLLWGIMTACFAGTHSVATGAMFWGVNGIGLSLVIPNGQSLIADYNDELNRGKAFGWLYLTGAVGAMLGTLYATNVGGMTPLGIEGWRFVFLTIALVSITIGIATFFLSHDPRFDSDTEVKDVGGGGPEGTSIWAALQAAVQFMKLPTFGLIILQGIVGSTPWNAMVFFTLYLQLIGMSDFDAALLYALFLGGTAFGGLLGGWIGDIAARFYPNHGRILATQFSVVAGVPFSLVLLKGLPRNGHPETVAVYAVLLSSMGSLISWAAPCFNNPAFSELVPARMRNLIYAFDRSFEMALAALAAPIVGWIAEYYFGFQGSAATTGTASKDQKNAEALGNALLVCMIFPWFLCFVFYTGLHFTYPQDKRRAQQMVEVEPLLASDAAS